MSSPWELRLFLIQSSLSSLSTPLLLQFSRSRLLTSDELRSLRFIPSSLSDSWLHVELSPSTAPTAPPLPLFLFLHVRPPASLRLSELTSLLWLE